jgi:hypothetical protein
MIKAYMPILRLAHNSTSQMTILDTENKKYFSEALCKEFTQRLVSSDIYWNHER